MTVGSNDSLANTTTNAAADGAEVAAAAFCGSYFINYTLNGYMVTAESVVGFLVNAFCAVVFWRILRARVLTGGHMFKYLFVKAVCDCLQWVGYWFSEAYFCDPSQCSTYSSYVMQLWLIWSYWYFELVTELYSSFLEVAATLDCYLTISQRWPACQTTLAFYAVSGVTLAYTLLFYFYVLFWMDIVEKPPSGNSSEVLFGTDYTEFFYSRANSLLRLVDTTVRDVILLLALVLLNLLIVYSLRQTVLRKQRLHHTQQRHRAASQASTVSSAKRATRQRAVMIACTGVNFVCGHTPILVYNLPIHPYTAFWNCYQSAAYFFFYASFGTPVVFYYLFNGTFKRFSKRLLLCGGANETPPPDALAHMAEITVRRGAAFVELDVMPYAAHNEALDIECGLEL